MDPFNDPWDAEAPVYRSLSFECADDMMDEISGSNRSLDFATGAAPAMNMTSVYDDSPPVYRSMSVIPQVSALQSISSLGGNGKSSLGMGMPSLGGMGKPSLGMGMPSLGSSTMISSASARSGAGPLVASLPLPYFYQLERTHHRTNPEMADADLARCISESLTDLGADFVLKVDKAKWKVTAFDHGARSEYRIRLFSRAPTDGSQQVVQGQSQQETVVEFQRRQGGAVHFHRSYSEAVNGLRRRGALLEARTGDANPQAVLLDATALSALLPPSSAADVLSGLTTLVSTAANAQWVDARKEAVESLTRLSPHHCHALMHHQTGCVAAMVKLILAVEVEPSALNGHVTRCAVTVLADLFANPTTTSDQTAPHVAAVVTPVMVAAVVRMAVGSNHGPTDAHDSTYSTDAMDTTHPTDIHTQRECCRLLLAIVPSAPSAVGAAIQGDTAAAAWLHSISSNIDEGECGAVDPRLRELVLQLHRALKNWGLERPGQCGGAGQAV